jgi:uncharacterized protein YjbJ (UPF0337 family)
MGIGDKLRHKRAEATGKVKEKQGKASKDPGRTGEGQAEQRKAHLKQAGEKLKDAFRR